MMRKLREDMNAFFDALYVDDRKVLVFGEGAPGARLMLIGEAPGESETLAGRPFVGRAGKNLDEFLALSGIARADVYITNVVKFRPTRVSPAGRIVNRPPTREEVELMLPWLKRELTLVAPKCVVTLGNVPLKALLGREKTIGACHGRLFENGGWRVFPLYHPASVLYNPALRQTYADDVKLLGEAARSL